MSTYVVSWINRAYVLRSDKVGLDPQVLFENGGRSIAEFIMGLRIKKNCGVVVFVGPNFNTSYALSAARHLKNRGIFVYVYLEKDLENFNEDIRKQYSYYLHSIGQATSGSYWPWL